MALHFIQAIPKISGTEATDSSWNDIGSLSKLLAASFYNLNTPSQTQSLVPDLCHTISMLAGVGSLAIRSSISRLLINFLQSLVIANTNDAVAFTKLKALLHQGSEPQILGAFGLARLAPGSDDYCTVDDVDESDALDEICKILLGAISLGSGSAGTSTHVFGSLLERS
jgi:neurofibromin 1